MSVLSTLALLVTAAVHREQQAHMKKRASFWPELDGSATELVEAQEDLKRALADRDEEIADLRRERDRQYEENAALIVRIAELENERDLTIARHYFGAQQPAGPDFRPPQIAQQQAAALQQQMAAQQNMQNAQQAQLAQYAGLQNQGLGQPLGLLGAQGLFNASFDEICNCVPARHDMFLRR